MVERELTRRLASLLWRLRRANLIEGGLLSIHAEIMQDRHGQPESAHRPEIPMADALIRWLGASRNSSDRNNPHEIRQAANPEPANGRDGEDDFEISASDHWDKQQAITKSFLRLANLACQPLERIGRYEASLWRQFVQVLFSLVLCFQRLIHLGLLSPSGIVLTNAQSTYRLNPRLRDNL